ncbi:MAG: hypothetical protein JKY09_06390, partial [Crocinitomicaceae bacterium]|nr:hypothetical protein [Crocinitomicaceae bacterium]
MIFLLTPNVRIIDNEGELINLIGNDIFMWTKRSLSKGLEYIIRNTKITIDRCTHSGFSIYLYPEYPKEEKAIYIHVGFFGSNVTIQDLVGNGVGGGYQDRRYGTLLVNLALQVIKHWFDDHQNILVSGRVSDVGDNDEKETCRARRNYFWSSFGFQLGDMEASNTHMEAKLIDLSCKKGELIQGYLPINLSVGDFWRYFNRPTIAHEMAECIKNINTDEYALQDVPDFQLMWGKREKTLLLGSRILNLGFLAIYVSVMVLLFPYLNINELLGVGFGAGVISWLANYASFPYLIKILPGYRAFERYSEKRNNEFERISEKIEHFEAENGGLIWRIFEPLSLMDESLLRDDFKQISSGSKGNFFSREGIER